MIKVTIFGGHDGRLNLDTQFYFTLFGACDVVRPTHARRLVALRHGSRRGAAGGGATPDGRDRPAGMAYKHPMRGRPYFFTMFGATEIKCPTLAEEFVDLREALAGGAMNAEDCDLLLAEDWLAEGSTGSFTLFGAFAEGQPPPEEEEVESLAINHHVGNVSEQAMRVLQLGIGQSDGQRRAILRQAVLAEV